jgi:hypothetical protein
MGSRQSIVRVQGGIGPSRPTIASACVVIAVWAFLLGAIALAISSVSLNYCALEPRLDFYTNTTETGDCQDEVLLGHQSCIDDAYRVNRFSGLTWFILHGILPLGLLTVAAMVPMLMWNAERIFWWLMAICVVTFFVASSMVNVMLAIWWANCKSHGFCVQARYYFDFTGEVSFRGADPWWIVHCCGNFLMWIASAAILVSTLYLQYLAGFAAMAMQFSGYSRSPDTDNRLIGDDATAVGDDVDDDGAAATDDDDDGSDEHDNAPAGASHKPISIPMPAVPTGGAIRQRAPVAAAGFVAASTATPSSVATQSVADRFKLPKKQPTNA